MTECECGYAGDRDQAIVSYLYEDAAPDERAAFDAHLSGCGRCRAELSALGGVRVALGRWAPPEPAGLGARRQPQAAGGVAWWRAIPAWAQVAAALLCLGVGAGIANLDVQYDAAGFRMRTGWSSPPAAPVAERVPPAAEPWRAEMTALEQRLRTDLRQSDVPSPPVRAASVDAEVLHRMRALLVESERREERELALRLAEAMRDINAQRQADLVRIDRNIGAMQNNTGREMLKQRATLSSINDYLVRASLQQRPQ